MSETGPRVAIVTGASRGIGRAITLALGERGWAVVVNYHQSARAASEVQRLVEADGARALVVQADITDVRDRGRLVATTLEDFGRIDLLVNNAGIAPRARLDILEATEESYDEVMETNLKGPFFLTQRVAREMIALIESGRIERPKIINIGSLSAYTSSTSRPEYCLSKAGVAMMTSLYADRLASEGIAVFEIRPGIINTDMTQSVRTKYDALIAAGLTPLQRWGEPDDVAQAVVAIAEDLLPFSTGEVINVDGGFHLRRL
jgi:NAD(P)-dependent dehydrogenase (short-subunit alcohol dehydrogenase family)